MFRTGRRGDKGVETRLQRCGTKVPGAESPAPPEAPPDLEGSERVGRGTLHPGRTSRSAEGGFQLLYRPGAWCGTSLAPRLPFRTPLAVRGSAPENRTHPADGFLSEGGNGDGRNVSADGKGPGPRLGSGCRAEETDGTLDPPITPLRRIGDRNAIKGGVYAYEGKRGSVDRQGFAKWWMENGFVNECEKRGADHSSMRDGNGTLQ